MRARDIMTTDVLTVAPGTEIREAAKLMVDHHISGLPVVDAAGHLAGIVTDGDLYRRTELGTERKRRSWLEVFGFDTRQAADYVASHAHTVGDVMTSHVQAVSPETAVQQIADLLERARIRRVPVVVDDRVVGIVSRANLVQALAAAPQEDTRIRLSDRRVRDLVIGEFKRMPWGPPHEGNVIVTDGVVHLWGYYPSDAELDALRVAVEGVPGVKGFEAHTYRFAADTGGRQHKPSEVTIEGPPDARDDTTLIG
jgi:CBS domain-containing protein